MPDSIYHPSDTIFAVSSPSSDNRVIIRITGPDTFEICQSLFTIDTPFNPKRRIIEGQIQIDNELELDALLYLFICPGSYTGEDLAEIHIDTNSSVVETLTANLLNLGLGTAGPGEFTARAYLNGKIDLAQAEAVNEIIVGSNAFQLQAAQKLLSGRLSESTRQIGSDITECLSLLEAGLDFSGEDIEFVSKAQAIKRLETIKQQLEELLSSGIQYESVMDLPSVGIAGAPNAGKSSLVNKLLKTERSIVSHEPRTTRDVLTGVLGLEHCKCVLFDCAGLILNPENILDELSQLAAVEALKNSSITVLCVDASKDAFREEIAVNKLINPNIIIPLATKCDLISSETLEKRILELNRLFGLDFMPVSVVTGTNLDRLLSNIDSSIIKPKINSGDRQAAASDASISLTLTARHKKSVIDATANITDAITEIGSGNNEVATMMLRAALQNISAIEQHLAQPLDDQILEQIFSNFCIGK